MAFLGGATVLHTVSIAQVRSSSGFADMSSLVYHLFEHDILVAHAKGRQPLISYAELSLPLPASRELWLAPDASSWHALHLQLVPEMNRSEVSGHGLAAHEELPLTVFDGRDKAIVVGTKLCTIAAQVWDYQQVRSLSSGSTAVSDASSELWAQARLQKL
jgi:hypothetical protein